MAILDVCLLTSGLPERRQERKEPSFTKIINLYGHLKDELKKKSPEGTLLKTLKRIDGHPPVFVVKVRIDEFYYANIKNLDFISSNFFPRNTSLFILFYRPPETVGRSFVVGIRKEMLVFIITC